MSDSGARISPAIEAMLLFVLVVIGLCVYYLPWLSGEQAFYQTDITNYFEPFCKFIAEGFKHGQLPLWNPYLYCGMPQAPVISPGMFYPGTLLFLPFAFSVALSIYLILHQAMAALGSFLLVRSLGWGRVAAVVAALGFGLCGYMYSAYQNFTLMATAVWLPWLFFFARKVGSQFERRNIVYAFGLSISVFLSIAGGRPEVWLASLTLVGAFMVASAVRTKRYRDLAWRIGACVLGLMMAMPIILPAFEWTRVSPRQHGIDLVSALTWSANWYDMLTTIFIPPLGNITNIGNPYYNAVGSRVGALPYIGSAYVGPVIFSLAMASIFSNWRWKWWVLGATVISLVICIGVYSPVAPFVWTYLPLFSLFRYPIKLIVVPCFLICLLAAKGTQLTVNRQASAMGLVISAVFWGACIVGGNWLESAKAPLPLFVSMLSKTSFTEPARLSVQGMFGSALAGTAAFGLGAVMICLMHRKKMAPAKVFEIGLPILLCVSMAFAMAAYYPKGASPEIFSVQPPMVAQINNHLDKSIPGLRYSSRCAFVYGDPLFFAVSQEETNPDPHLYAYMSQILAGDRAASWAVPDAVGYEGANKGAYDRVLGQTVVNSSFSPAPQLRARMTDAPMARFFANAAVDTIISQTELKMHEFVRFDPHFYKLVYQDPQFNWTMLKLSAHPRVYFADNIEWVTDKWHEFVERMVDPFDANGFLAHTYVQLDSPNDKSKIASHAPKKDYKIAAVADEPMYVSLDVELPGADRHMLVLCDSWYPGWTATDNGRPTHVYKVNGFFRGIAVQGPGNHRVEFRFQPWSVYGGMILAAVAALIYATAILFVSCGSRFLK